LKGNTFSTIIVLNQKEKQKKNETIIGQPCSRRLKEYMLFTAENNNVSK
jgi:hypothetical protein